MLLARQNVLGGNKLSLFSIGATILNETYFGARDGSILLGDIVCSGSESNILQCTHSSIGSHNCGPNDTVGVQCAESINNVSVCDTELSDQLWALMRLV